MYATTRLGIRMLDGAVRLGKPQVGPGCCKPSLRRRGDRPPCGFQRGGKAANRVRPSKVTIMALKLADLSPGERRQDGQRRRAAFRLCCSASSWSALAYSSRISASPSTVNPERQAPPRSQPARPAVRPHSALAGPSRLGLCGAVCRSWGENRRTAPGVPVRNHLDGWRCWARGCKTMLVASSTANSGCSRTRCSYMSRACVFRFCPWSSCHVTARARPGESAVNFRLSATSLSRNR
jgi:hypothetical protein